MKQTEESDIIGVDAETDGEAAEEDEEGDVAESQEDSDNDNAFFPPVEPPIPPIPQSSDKQAEGAGKACIVCRVRCVTAER